MMKTTLVRALALAATGAALGSGTLSTANASETYYNTWNAGQLPGQVGGVASTATDGWLWSDGKNNGTTAGASLNPWLGTAGGAVPFGYTGKQAKSWGVLITEVGDTVTVSAADSLARYGVAADIDTAKGAWEDAEASPRGWRHQMDFGLIKSQVDTLLTLTPSTVDSTFASNFGISLYEGMDTSTSWSHHGSWNAGYVAGDTSDANLAKVWADNPMSTQGLKFLSFIDSSGLGSYGGHSLSFMAEAGKVYSVFIGGRDGGTSWVSPIGGYSLQISAAPVPIPAAVWLFGSALAGMGLFGRRKNQGATET